MESFFHNLHNPLTPLKNHLKNKSPRNRSKRLFIPFHFMDSLADENLRHLNVVATIICAGGILNMIAVFFIHKENLSSEKTHFIYYALAVGISFVCDIWAILMRTVFKEASYKAKNLPFYVCLVGMISVFMCNFWESDQILNCYNGFLIFGCLEVIVIVFFNIYPNIFDLINFPFFVASYIVVAGQVGKISSMNIFVFFLILHFLSLYKWIFLKDRLVQTEKIEDINEKLKREIELAANIQKNFLNYSVPDVDGWDIAYFSKAMAGVSGDMFDFYRTGRNLDGFGIFDVSGHGISSGLITMLVKNIINGEFYNEKCGNLEETMLNINEKVIEQKGNIENYLTGLLAKVNGNGIEFVSAGHPLPLVFRKKDKSVEYYSESKTDGFGVIGLADFPVKYNTETLKLSEGDELILFSDGIFDCTDTKGEEYGKERFLKSAQNYTSLKAKDQINFLVDDVRAFCSGSAQKDDITLMIIKKL